MSPVDAALVRRKLGVIVQNLDDLAAIGMLSIEEYAADRMRRKAAERLLQELIEAAVDANLHILRERGWATPPDYFTSFIELGSAAVIPPDLAQRLAPAAGLRNRLVHEYDKLDDVRVLSAIRSATRDFRDFLAAIESFLAQQGV